MILVDANIILRWLLRDDPQQVRAIESYLERAKRSRVQLQLNILSIAETVWILEGKGWSREMVTDGLLELCASDLFQVVDRDIVTEALQHYLEAKVSFVDAVQAAIVTKQGMQGILSFDRDYDELGVKRIEPGVN